MSESIVEFKARGDNLSFGYEKLEVSGSPFLVRFKITISRSTGSTRRRTCRSRTPATIRKKKTEGHMHGKVDQILEGMSGPAHRLPSSTRVKANR